MHSPLQYVFFLLLFAAAVIAALLVFLFFRWTRREPWPSRDNFRFLTDPALDGSGMVLREDTGPGWPHRVIAADQHDTSPRAGEGDNLLADLGLAHTVRAAWEVDELPREELRGLCNNLDALQDALVTPGLERQPGLFRYVDAVPVESLGREAEHKFDGDRYVNSQPCPAIDSGACSWSVPDNGIQECLFCGGKRVSPAPCTGERPWNDLPGDRACLCKTPLTCCRAGQCADTLPITNPKD